MLVVFAGESEGVADDKNCVGKLDAVGSTEGALVGRTEGNDEGVVEGKGDTVGC